MDLNINDFVEFYNNRKILRVYYAFLDDTTKRELKTTIYNFELKNYVKDLIWEYLNEPKGSFDYVFDYQIKQLMEIYLRNNKLLKAKNEDNFKL